MNQIVAQLLSALLRISPRKGSLKLYFALLAVLALCYVLFPAQDSHNGTQDTSRNRTQDETQSWPQTRPQTWTGEVISIHDGDGVKVRNKYGNVVTIRLYAIDAPEMKGEGWPAQPYSREARDNLKKLLPPGTRVNVREDQQEESYGRTVGTLILEDGREVNYLLLEQGYAWYYAKHCEMDFCPQWRKAAETAKQQKRGLWAGKNPVPPWKWKWEHQNN